MKPDVQLHNFLKFAIKHQSSYNTPMQKKKNFFPVFLGLFIISALLFFLSTNGFLSGFRGFLEQSVLPIRTFTFGIFHKTDNSDTAKLKEENIRLTSELVDKITQDKENKALRDQFQTAYPSAKNLLPAKVIGLQSGELIIDKGTKDTVKKGMIVVFKNNLIGNIAKTSENLSVVTVITNTKNLTAETLKTESIGVVKPLGGGLILDNVDLGENLEKGDLVVTKGDLDSEGKGNPSDLVIGKIVSINKKASNLFQSASVVSVVDFSKLEMVFVLKN